MGGDDKVPGERRFRVAGMSEIDTTVLYNQRKRKWLVRVERAEKRVSPNKRDNYPVERVSKIVRDFTIAGGGSALRNSTNKY